TSTRPSPPFLSGTSASLPASPANPVAATQSRSRAAAVSRHAVSPALDTATSGTAPALSSIRENAIAQSLNDHRSAIDDESVAGDVGAGARGQEQRSAGNLFRLTKPAKHGCRLAPGAALRVFVEGAGELGHDQPGRDAVDADIVRPPFGGETAAQR